MPPSTALYIIIMYSYYFLSGLGPIASIQKYLWWKKCHSVTIGESNIEFVHKYLIILVCHATTKYVQFCVTLQVQFCVTFAQSFYAYYHDSHDCNYPRGLLLANVIYQITLLSLFTHFFVKKYFLHGNKDRISSSTYSETVS